MKTLWNIISFLAVVHLLALLIFVAWLWQSGRLDHQRVLDLRQFLGMTTAEAQTAASKSLRELEAERLRLGQEQHKSRPSTDSETQIRRLTLLSEQEEQSRRRLDDERQMLQQQLSQATAHISEEQAAFDRERAQWERSVKSDRTRRIDEQFLQTVKLYEQATPKQAKKMLEELIAQNRLIQAVEYLDAMNVRAASKVLREFKTDEEIKMATELLEKLRTLGQSAGSAQDSPGTTDASAHTASAAPASKTGESAP